jgi:hypothetical protein
MIQTVVEVAADGLEVQHANFKMAADHVNAVREAGESRLNFGLGTKLRRSLSMKTNV